MAFAAARKTNQAPPATERSAAKPRKNDRASPSPVATLEIGPPADAFEREADRVADEVVRGDSGPARRIGSSGSAATPEIARAKGIDTGTRMKSSEESPVKPDEEEEQKDSTKKGEKQHVQRRSVDGARPADASVERDLGVLRRSGGQPLGDPVRGFMESRFGADFADVRVHSGGRASMLARALNARAFTVGRDIVFGSGEFRPESRGGRHLIAHELTHVLQQSGGESPSLAGDGLGQRRVIQREVATGSSEGSEDTELPTTEDLLEVFRITREKLRGSVLTLARHIVDLALKGPAGTRVAALLHPPLDMAVRRTLKMDDQSLDLIAAPGTSGGATVTTWELDFGDHDRPPEKRRRPLHGGSGDVSGDGADTEVVEIEPHSKLDALNEQAALDEEIDPSLRTTATAPTPSALPAPVAPSTTSAENVGAGLEEVPEAAPGTAPTAAGAPGTVGGAPAPEAAPAAGAPALGAPGALAVAGAPGKAKGGAPGVPAPGTPVAPAAAAPAPAKEPPTPRTPETDPNFQAMTERAEDRKVKQGAHGSGSGAAHSAQAAAAGPSNEVTSKAAAKQVGKMDDAPAGEFSADAFVNAVIGKLQSIDPQTLGDVAEFRGSGRLREVRAGVQGTVSQQRENAQGQIEHAATQAPSTEGIEPKAVEPLAPQPVGEAPGSVAADKAMPMQRTEGDVSGTQRANVQSLNQDLAGSNITEAQLATSNEPTFVAALDAKHSVEADAVSGPAAFRDQEGALRTDAQKQAEALAGSELDQMHGARAKELGGAGATQSDTKAKDEQARQQIADKLESIYDGAKSDVKGRLDALDGAVAQKFDDGAAAARENFETFVAARIAAYKEERYSGIEGAGLWLIDLVKGLPDEVNQFYREGKQRFISDMRDVVVDIAAFVESELAAVKAMIAEGRERVTTFVASLPKELQSIGAEAAQSISGRFDELDGQVKDAFDSLVEKVADRFKENIDAVDGRIAEMQKESAGVFDDALKQLTGVIGDILKLRDDLLAVFAAAADVVETIIANPIGFLQNLVAGIAQGVQSFVKNIFEHLKEGFLEWLFGQLAAANIKRPKSFDLMGIIGLVLDVLGLTRENIEGRARKILGDTVVDAIIATAEFFVVLATEGPAGVVRLIQDKLGDWQSMLIDQIRNFVVEKVIRKGIEFILSLLTPASAFIQAVSTIIDVGVFVYQKAQQLVALVRAVTESLAAIAAGNVGKLAASVENALASAIPVVIGFLASLVGLGDLGEKVAEILETVRKPINNAIDAVLTRIKEFFVGKAEPKAAGEIGETLHFQAGGEAHQLAFEVAGGMPALMLSSAPITGIFESELVRTAAQASDDAEKARVEGAGVEAQANTLAAQAKAATDSGNVEEAARLNQQIDANEERIAELLEIVLAGGLEPVSVPVEMDGEEHTLTVTSGPNAEIEIASKGGKSFQAQAEEAISALEGAEAPTTEIGDFRKGERDALSGLLARVLKEHDALRMEAGARRPSKEEAAKQAQNIAQQLASVVAAYAKQFRKKKVSLSADDLDVGDLGSVSFSPTSIGEETLGGTMTAILTPRWIGKRGTRARSALRVGVPEKSAAGRPLSLDALGIDRGHLLANLLGGSGSQRENLAAIAAPTNRGPMRDLEGEVHDAVAEGRPIDYAVRATYSRKGVRVIGKTMKLPDPVPDDVALTIAGREPVKGGEPSPKEAPAGGSLGNAVSEEARKRIILAFAVQTTGDIPRQLTGSEIDDATLT